MWKKEHRINAEERIASLRYILDKAISSGISTSAERNRLKTQLNQAYIDEETFWKEKSRKVGYFEGDRNTKYFHSVTKAKRAKSRILSIQDDTHVIKRGDNAVAGVAVKYFQELYKTTGTQGTLCEEVFQDFQQKVSGEMNAELTKPVSVEEIRNVVFTIGPHKAPGPDGFTGVFCQQFWPDINSAIFQEVNQFFEEGRMEQTQSYKTLSNP